MKILQRILGSLEARLSQPWLNWWKTVYLNFRTLPLNQAIHMPIYVYSGVKLFILSGKIVIDNTSISRGMIKIGKNCESFTCCDGSGFIQIGSKESKIIFKGQAWLGINSKIRVVGNGVLTFGDKSFIGSSVRIICNGGQIEIGEGSRIAFETAIMNSGFHYVEDLTTGIVRNHTLPIRIGSFNWIGNRSSISGGTTTKPYTIICSNSLTNRDYSKLPENNQLLGGQPAKLLKANMKRVFDASLETKLMKYFTHHPEQTSCNITNL